MYTLRGRGDRGVAVQSFFDLDDDDGRGVRDGRREEQKGTVAADGSDGPGSTAPPPRAKFVNFTSPTTVKLVEKLSSFRQDYNLPNGKKLTITPLTNELIDPTADTLTEAFGDAMGYLNTYQTFLRNQIGEYLNNHIRMLPKALVLVAVVSDEPANGEDTREEGDDSETDDTGIFVGTCEISFHPSTRSKHLTLNSPADMPYLCNMAVREGHKGKGYGTLLLDAAERVVLSTGYKSLYLHVRHVDAPALGLYRKYGYEPEGEDMGLVRLLGMDQRFLMRKYIGGAKD